MSQPQRLLRHKPTGILYVYQEVFAARGDFEEIIDVEAKDVTPEHEKPRRQRRAKPEEIEAEAQANAEAVNQDASRDLP